MRKLSVKLFCVLISLCICSLAYAVTPNYQVTKKLLLGGDGGWDYLTADSITRKLYISHGNHVLVFDMDTERLISDIPDTPGVHGIALAPELGRGYTSNGKENTISVFDLATNKVTNQLKTGANPDAIIYDQFSKKIFVFNGTSKDVTVADAISGNVVTTIPLGGKPEYAQADGNGKVYVYSN